jgi:CDGSH-type Zn-finger protein
MMTDASNILILQIDGPNLVTGALAVVTPTGVRVMKTAMLCRCGHSQDKPFCDGAHVRSGFSDAADLPAEFESAAIESGPLTIQPITNGPNRCEGPLAIHGPDGRIASSDLTFLCRCGESRRKPYCDGTHKKIGFRG